MYTLTPQIEKAILFATVAHRHQEYDGKPYTFHLAKTADVLHEYFPNNEDLITAGWLHDTIEDTSTTFENILDNFNPHIAKIVESVTDEQGKNRKERKLKTYPKTKQNQLGIKVKLADRIANLSYNAKLIDMYKTEHEEFKQFLYNTNAEPEVQQMWLKIEKLLFESTD